MSSIFQWPFKRKSYAGLGNPRFVDDVKAANEAVIDASIALSALSPIDFAIISGFDFTAGTPGTYSGGIFYLNGQFYSQGTTFSEGLYLAPNPTDIEPQPFSDGNTRLIYTSMVSASTASPTGATPIFSGNMNAYRIGLKVLKSNITSLQATISALGNAAFMNVGVTGGTVAAGDDSRFGYTKNEADNKFALLSKTLYIDNSAVYTPSGPYNPATKVYADQAAGFRILWIGHISADGATISKLTGSLNITTVDHLGAGGYRVYHNSGSTNIFIDGISVDPANKTTSVRSMLNLDTSTFEAWISDDSSPNDANFELRIFQYY